MSNKKIFELLDDDNLENVQGGVNWEQFSDLFLEALEIINLNLKLNTKN